MIKLYRIKHKPTGGYYEKLRFSYTLSTEGKVYKSKYHSKNQIGDIIIDVSKSSQFYLEHSELEWTEHPTMKNRVSLQTNHDDWEVEQINC